MKYYVVLLYTLIALYFQPSHAGTLPQEDICHYYPDNTISTIEHYTQEKFEGSEQLYWTQGSAPGEQQLSAKVWRDSQDIPTACRVFEYDEFGALTSAVLYGNLSGECLSPLLIDVNGHPVNNGIESYSTRWIYYYEENLLRIRQIEDNSKTVDFYYDPIIKRVTSELAGNGLSVVHRRFFKYNVEGLLESITIDDGSSNDSADMQHVQERHQISFTYIKGGAAAGQTQSILEKYFNPSAGKYIPSSLVLNSYDSEGKLENQMLFDGTGTLLDSKHPNESTTAISQEELVYEQVSGSDIPVSSLFNVRGNPTKCLYADGSYELFAYHLDGTLKSMIDREGIKTTYERDFFGRPTVIHTYDTSGGLISSTINIFNSFHLIEYFASEEGLHYRYTYDYQGNLLNVEDDFHPKNTSDENGINSGVDESTVTHDSSSDDQSTLSWLWHKACDFGSKFSKKVASIKGYLSDIKKELSYTEYIKEDADRLLEQIFGKGFLQLAGYYRDDSRIGIYNPGHEVHDKVRVTLINGILTIMSDLEESLQQFSKAHGGNTIHYVFRSTEGWTNDLFAAGLSKMGRISLHARLLADLWKKLIQEMGGPHNGGKIMHYAHSIGATETFDAKKLLTPEERKMIHVITMGSPTLIPDNAGFANVINYVSKRDLVCLLDPRGYINGWLTKEGNVRFLGSFLGVPPVEHTLSSSSYAEIIVLLGEQFMQSHQQ